MTELEKKAAKVKEAVKKTAEAFKCVHKITWHDIDKAMSGIIMIWAISTVSFFAWRIITPDVISNADAGFWGFVTLMITSLFVIIHSRFKK